MKKILPKKIKLDMTKVRSLVATQLAHVEGGTNRGTGGCETTAGICSQ